MRFKKGVKINGIKPEMWGALIAAESIAKTFGVNDIIITSVSDGKHSRGSLHYVGYGVDVRHSYFKAKGRKGFCDLLRDALTDEFDVVLEKTHVHIEFQPKG